MAKLTSFVYCINAERVPALDGKGEGINAMGVVSALMPEFVPGTFSFSVIFSILDVDIAKENKIRIIFKDNKYAHMIDTGDLALPANSDDSVLKLPSEHRGLNLSMDFRNVVFEENGEYCTEIYFNDSLLSSNPIYVQGRR